VVMDPERHGPQIGCSANYIPVLSSERAPHFILKKFSDVEKQNKSSEHGHKLVPHPDILTDRPSAVI
jgi:hypothetical protein